jgi:hypothetical protein
MPDIVYVCREIERVRTQVHASLVVETPTALRPVLLLRLSFGLMAWPPEAALRLPCWARSGDHMPPMWWSLKMSDGL